MDNAQSVLQLLLHHGTNDIFSKSILDNGFCKIPEKRDDHWLGSGIYFYREDREQAYTWAISRFKYCKDTRAYHVLQTVLTIDEGNFLNLDSRGGMETFRKFISDVEKILNNVKFSNPSPEKFRHFIMNLLPEKYSVIQRTFSVASKYDNIDALSKMNLGLLGVQVCVRDEKVITDKVLIVKKGDKLRRFV